ncbi:Serine protease HTRA2 [Schistosoma japonicum]|uniref:Serine protease HTRA2 n=1 Tax=Schistosoma japonicum TaxID=6182 RepID=A0A4Z2DKW9_SCHJA|nr:Serine protease HTRA2 [Schistosoma japonicum]
MSEISSLQESLYSSNRSNRQDQYSDFHQSRLLFKSALLSTALTVIWHDDDLNGNQQKFNYVSHAPLIAKCAEVVTPMSKDRQAAIKALDVVADVAQDVKPAVVSITSTDKGFLSIQSRSTGSGFIVDSLGHVVTNAHVVGYRGDVVVHLCDGRSFPGKVLAVDVSSDLALIRESLPHLPMANNLQSIRPGQFVLALGSPLMLANSVTVGVVSAVDRDLGHSEGLKYIQTDAIITFGNSGGPLVNLYGEVIGVNAMVAGTGVGFAIPVDQVRKFIQLALKASSHSRTSSPISSKSPTDPYILSENPTSPDSGTQRRYLGLVMRTLTPDLAFELASRGGQHFVELSGVLIHAVLRNSPAQRAGLKAGDVIVAIDGLPITNAQQVYTATESREQLTITVVRQGKRITIDHIQTEKI